MSADPSRAPRAPHGIALVDKPAGRTSHDVVAWARRQLGTRRIGHAGTLDPMATGLLVLGVGHATRLLTGLVGEDKEYLATIRLGVSTSTEDAEGETTATAAPGAVAALDEAAVEAAMAALRGPISQVPSAVSAIKVDGVRAYRRVRDGEEVALPPREVVISAFERLGPSRPTAAEDGCGGGVPALDLDVRVACSSGTYVRALARDLGDALGVGGHLTALRRTRVGEFRIEEARAVDDAFGPSDLLAAAEVAARRFGRLDLGADEAIALGHGKRIPTPAGARDVEPGAIRAGIAPDGRLVGLVELGPDGAKSTVNFPVEGDGA